MVLKLKQQTFWLGYQWRHNCSMCLLQKYEITTGLRNCRFAYIIT